MAAVNILSNIRFWIMLGIIFALIIGPVGEFSSTLIVLVLIVQMTLSMDGLTFNAESFKKNKAQIIYATAACFIISTGTALLMGSFFIADHPNIWNGWVLLAAVPCAVSCVMMSFFLRGNTVMCVIALAAIYLIALMLTPLITKTVIGESVSVLKIFSYVILFVAVPMAASVPVKRAKISRTVKVIVINVMIFIMIILSLGENRGYLFSESGIVVLIVIACVVRIFGVSLIMLYLMKKRNTDRDNSIVYISMAVWKNSGLAVALCFVLFGNAAEAAIPCAISLLIEVLWFAAMSGYIERVWPSVKQPSAVNG
ncbi:MAG: Na+-dependent transporter [Candidatus Methanoplasma sp.]|jgi:BASS family bile acid:Na+ symporter|nr:Na+-dependent transporter [Candidatus Methanoplasma sp.]